MHCGFHLVQLVVHFALVEGEVGGRGESGQEVTHLVQVNVILGNVFIQSLQKYKS